MHLSDWASLIGAIASLIAVAVTGTIFVKQFRFNESLARSIRNTDFECRLMEVPKAFELYGVNLEEAKRREVDPKLIAFLVLAINALTAEYESFTMDPGARKELREWDTFQLRRFSLLQYVEHVSDYYRNLLSQRRTAEVWFFARYCVSKAWRDPIDAYLKREFPDLSFSELFR